jgi:hypothetical protein
LRDRFAEVILEGALRGQFRLVGGPDIGSATLQAATITTMCVRISEETLRNYPLTSDDLQDRHAELALRMVGVRRD